MASDQTESVDPGLLTNYPEPQRYYTNHTWLFISIFMGMISLVIGLTLLLWNARDRSNSNARMIKEFSGVDSGETEEFNVKAPWEIRWEHAGDIAAIEWLTKESKSEAYVSMHKKPIRNYGQRNIGRSGDFRLKITGTGKWKVQVWQFEKQVTK